MARAAAKKTELGKLPEWDLSDLYAAPDSPALEADLVRAGREAAEFRAAHHGQVAALDGAGLAAAIARFEAIDEALTRVSSYAGLLHAGNVTDPEIGRFYQTAQERVTERVRDSVRARVQVPVREQAQARAPAAMRPARRRSPAAATRAQAR